MPPLWEVIEQNPHAVIMGVFQGQVSGRFSASPRLSDDKLGRSGNV
jgi:hypothetical protein